MAPTRPHAAQYLRLLDTDSIDHALWDESAQAWQLGEFFMRSRSADLYRARPAEQHDAAAYAYILKWVRQPAASDPLVRQSVVREALVGRQVSHQHLIPVLSQQTADERPFVVMPWIDGHPLDLVVRHVGRLPIPHALWIGRQVAEALQVLHDAGWIHGDVKPANIVVSTAGHATLVDLGSVQHRAQPLRSWERPLIGTLAYVAPEMLVTDRAIDAAADIYSLGATLYELLTGQPPFSATSAADMARAHLQQRPAEMVNVLPMAPPALNALVPQMLAKDPLRRPSSAAELIGTLTTLELETLELRWKQPA
jgi:serine/threonine-protein kinase